MTPDEAGRVAEIMTHADNGCSTCAGDLHVRLVREFPELDWEPILVGALERGPSDSAGESVEDAREICARVKAHPGTIPFRTF